MKNIVLGSTSPYRKELLEKLGLPFETAAPAIDESKLPGETAEQLVQRLAQLKAEAVASSHTRALVIGSDQVATCDSRILGKPGDRDTAIAQLRQSSGRTVTFHTGLCLLDTDSGRVQLSHVPYAVHFRDLSDAQIRRYVDAEQPFNCAGSFKSEGFGITLFARMEGEDPNALIGLPLIRLVDMLHREGIELP